jgi:peptidyl-prolyl cis-trans isomerase D
MISWIQRTFQQHFKWVFLTLLVLVIVSFVFVTNASRGIGRSGERKLPSRPFFGLDLSHAEDQRTLGADAQLSIYLRYNPQRQVPESQVSQYAFNRHASLHLADQLHLPQPTSEQLVAHIRTLRAFSDPKGEFDAKRYTDFIDSLKTNPRTTEADVSRVISDDVRVQNFEKLLAGPGYVLPSDVSELLAKRDTTWTLALAAIDGTAFAPAIDTSDATLGKWFETNARRYEIAERVSVAALQVSATPFLAGVTLSDARVRAAFDANPSAYPAPAGTPAAKLDPATGKPADLEAAFAATRPAVEAALRQKEAEKAALTAASDLTVQLLERNVKPADLAAFVTQHPGTTLAELGPITAGTMPAALGGSTASAQILPEAERLSADRPYSNPVATPAGAAVLVWRETLPARAPTFAEVKSTVLADYRAAELRRLFNEAGRGLQLTTTIATKLGKSFAAAVTEGAAAAGLKVTIKNPKPFNLSGSFPEDLDYTAIQALQSLSKGKVSDFLPTGENAGLLVYAADQQLPAIDPASAPYKELRTRLADNLCQANAQSLLASLVEAELAKSAPAAP